MTQLETIINDIKTGKEVQFNIDQLLSDYHENGSGREEVEHHLDTSIKAIEEHATVTKLYDHPAVGGVYKAVKK
jgi:hypothetical protein